MAIRQLKKQVELPPAHLYLEDIEEITGLLAADAKNKWHVPEEHIRMGFTIGKKQCDSLEDLKTLGGTWREFEAEVWKESFRVSTSGVVVSSFDEGRTFDYVLRLMTARRSSVRSALRKLPLWAAILWPNLVVIVTVNTALMKVWKQAFFVGLVIPAIIGFWAISAHTIVELRYSHEPSPKFQVVRDWGGKAIWIVLGVLLTTLAQWLLHLWK